MSMLFSAFNMIVNVRNDVYQDQFFVFTVTAIYCLPLACNKHFNKCLNIVITSYQLLSINVLFEILGRYVCLYDRLPKVEKFEKYSNWKNLKSWSEQLMWKTNFHVQREPSFARKIAVHVWRWRLGLISCLFFMFFSIITATRKIWLSISLYSSFSSLNSFFLPFSSHLEDCTKINSLKSAWNLIRR